VSSETTDSERSPFGLVAVGATAPDGTNVRTAAYPGGSASGVGLSAGLPETESKKDLVRRLPDGQIDEEYGGMCHEFRDVLPTFDQRTLAGLTQDELADRGEPSGRNR